MKKQTLEQIISQGSDSNSFDLNAINNIQVLDILTGKLIDSELHEEDDIDHLNGSLFDWGTFGGHFYFSIHKNRTQFYTPDAFRLIVEIKNPSALLINRGSFDTKKYDVNRYIDGWFRPTTSYPKRPGNIWEFAIMMDGFYTNLKNEFEYLELEYHQRYSYIEELESPTESLNLENGDNDLPF